LYVDLEVYLQRLDVDSPETVNARIAQHSFPDLRAFQDPDGCFRYCSEAVVPFVDYVDIKHDVDGRTYATAFTIDKGVQVFSDPPLIYVGNHNILGFGEIPDERGLLYVKETWGDKIHSFVQDYFKKHAPSNW
jgi:hypothetical protein